MLSEILPCNNQKQVSVCTAIIPENEKQFKPHTFPSQWSFAKMQQTTCIITFFSI